MGFVGTNSNTYVYSGAILFKGRVYIQTFTEHMQVFVLGNCRLWYWQQNFVYAQMGAGLKPGLNVPLSIPSLILGDTGSQICN